MPKITGINVYPVKSAAGVALSEALLTDTGFANDREWMLIDSDGTAVTQRERSNLALVQPAFTAEGLKLSAPGMGDIMVPPQRGGAPLDCNLFGETCRGFGVDTEVDAWFSDYLDAEVRFVARDPAFLRRGGVQYPTRDERPTSFVDNYGVLILSRASLDDLNERLAVPVPMNRFRPNIVIEGVSAYEEEMALGFSVADVHLAPTNVCTRCGLTNIDQATAAVGREPFKTLSGFRFDETYRGVRFGAYVAVATGVGARLRVGDEVGVRLAA